MPPNLRVLLIGCGNIAGGFDTDRPDGTWPFTHAGAFRRHGGFDLLACTDPDLPKAAAFARRWGVQRHAAGVADLGLVPGGVDVVGICSPTVVHGEHLQAALALQPRLVFCEKPVTYEVADTLRCLQACERQGVALAVNHTRRWAPDVQRLRAELASGQWGAIRSVVGTYNKGVLNNGGHMVDLLHMLVGPLAVVGVGQPVWDFWDNDPSVPATLLSAAGVPVSLQVGHASDYAFFELQLVTERGVIAMENGGTQWRFRRAVPSPQFKGYQTLDAGLPEPGTYAEAMAAAATNIHNHLCHGEALASTGTTALQAQRVCETIRGMALDRRP